MHWRCSECGTSDADFEGMAEVRRERDAAVREVERLREALRQVVACDFRGPKPREIAIAEQALAANGSGATRA
jgi:hypothetical protein